MAGRTASDWITYRAAQQILGDISYPAFARLVRDGRFTVRQVPGTLPKVRRSEVEALAAATIRPARSPIGDCDAEANSAVGAL